MKKLALVLAISGALAACGSKQQQPTTPSNSADASKTTGAMGGKTYGGSAAPAPKPTGDAPPADPCAGP